MARMSGTRDKVTVTGSHSNKRDEGTTELTLLQRDDGSSSELFVHLKVFVIHLFCFVVLQSEIWTIWACEE